MNYYTEKKTDKACNEMQRAIEEDPGYANAYSLLGEWYFNQHEFSEAADIFQQAYNRCRKGNILFAMPLARSLVFADSIDKAMPLLAGYNGSDKNEWEKLREQAQFIQQAISHAWPDTLYSLHNMGPRINTPYPELFPYMSLDTATFYFTRQVNNVDNDFFYATPDTCGGWYTARNMGNPPNTADQELAQVMSADGHYLFFTRCENRCDNGWAGGGCDLYMAYRADSVWSVPQSFGGTINSPYFEGMASLSPDNRQLYFVSDRPGGYGGMDIWVSDFVAGLWQLPRNLGPEINTAGDETAPFIAIDDKTLYFSSSGHPGMGGSDLYVSRRIDDTTWSKPVNMGYPINSSADEMSQCITPDGKKIYFASDRDSISGNYDIYEMKLPDDLQPQPVSYIKGYVYDSLSNDRLNYANIYVRDAGTGQQIFQFQSNRGDATFTMILPVGGRYVCTTDRIGYTEHSDTISFSGQYLQNALEYDIALVPEDYVRPIKDTSICTIHFPVNSATLTDSDKTLIYQAMAPWLQEKGITVMVNGYTDNTGTPIINEQLSYQRASLVSQDLVDIGVDSLTIKSQGWGEANPIAPNDNEENMSRNRRVEIIIKR